MIGERQPPPPARPSSGSIRKQRPRSRGGDAVQVKGAKRDIRVEFASQMLYTDGRTKYTGFKAFVDDRGGRSFEISGNEAWVGKDLSAYDVTGNVALKTSDGLTATTPQATFTEAEGILQRRRSGAVSARPRRPDRAWASPTIARSIGCGCSTRPSSSRARPRTPAA